MSLRLTEDEADALKHGVFTIYKIFDVYWTVHHCDN